MTRILQGFAFSSKLGLFYLNLNGATKFKYEKKNEKNSGRSSKMTPSSPILLLLSFSPNDAKAKCILNSRVRYIR